MKSESLLGPLRVTRRVGTARWGAQRGVTLWIVMVLVAILALVAASQSASITALFRGSRNSRDMVLARQAAEAALRDAEADVTCKKWDSSALQLKAAVSPDIANVYCQSLNPVCAQLMPTVDAPGIRVLGRNPGVPADVNWDAVASCTDGSCAVEFGGKTGVPRLTGAGLAQQPRYHVDVVDIADDGGLEPSPLFRISARGYGATTSTVVELQAIYRPCK